MYRTDEADGASTQHKRTRLRIQQHARRCRNLPPLKPAEADRLIAEFVAKRDGPTKCRAAYLVPLQQYMWSAVTKGV